MIARALWILAILASTLPSCNAPAAKSTIKNGSYYLAQLRKSEIPDANTAYFLSKVKEFVQGVAIYDWAKVGKALSMRFLAYEKRFLYPPLCSNEYARKTSSLRAYTPESSWYAATPTGVQEMFVPRVFINPEYKQGDPTFFTPFLEKSFAPAGWICEIHNRLQSCSAMWRVSLVSHRLNSLTNATPSTRWRPTVSPRTTWQDNRPSVLAAG